MYSSMTEIQFTTFFNDIVNRFYEAEQDVKRLGETLGLHIDENYFVSIAFLYPSISNITFQQKEELKNTLPKIKNLPELNRQIAENQFLYTEKGVVTFLVGKTRQELLEVLPKYKEEALQVIAEIGAAEKIRIGIGIPETSVKGIRHTYNNAIDAIHAGEIFKKERTILEYMGMEIYSSINAMITNYGERITSIVLKQLEEQEQRVLTKYYKCKEDISKTAAALELSEDEVKRSLQTVRENTGLDVNDTEDNFKLHLVMIAKKVLGANKKIEEVRKNHEV